MVRNQSRGDLGKSADEFLAQMAESNLRLQAMNHSDALAKVQ